MSVKEQSVLEQAVGDVTHNSTWIILGEISQLMI